MIIISQRILSDPPTRPTSYFCLLPSSFQFALVIVHRQRDDRARAGQHLLRIAALLCAARDPIHLAVRPRLDPGTEFLRVPRCVGPRDAAIVEANLDRAPPQSDFYFNRRAQGHRGSIERPVVAERGGIDRKIRRRLIKWLSFPEQRLQRLRRILGFEQGPIGSPAQTFAATSPDRPSGRRSLPSSRKRATFSGRMTTPPPVTTIAGPTTSSFSKNRRLFRAETLFPEADEDFADRHLERGRDHFVGVESRPALLQREEPADR